MPQRTDVSEEVGLGSREDNAVHPLLVIFAVYQDRREKASLTGSRPPSSHQSACDQCRSTLALRRYVFQDLVQDFRRKRHGCLWLW